MSGAVTEPRFTPALDHNTSSHADPKVHEALTCEGIRLPQLGGATGYAHAFLLGSCRTPSNPSIDRSSSMSGQ